MFGSVIDTPGHLVVPGRQRRGVRWTIAVGIVAAIVGTGIAAGLGVADSKDADWIERLIPAALAAAGMVSLGHFKARSRPQSQRGCRGRGRRLALGCAAPSGVTIGHTQRCRHPGLRLTEALGPGAALGRRARLTVNLVVLATATPSLACPKLPRAEPLLSYMAAPDRPEWMALVTPSSHSGLAPMPLRMPLACAPCRTSWRQKATTYACPHAVSGRRLADGPE
ncbi:hypothetical protein [Streptomyces sp. NPDC001970]